MPKMKFYDGAKWVELDAKNADTVGGKLATDFAPATHSHSEYALTTHTHDDRYYTETEVNNLLAGKLSTTAKAVDSDKLDGLDSTAFSRQYSASIGGFSSAGFVTIAYVSGTGLNSKIKLTLGGTANNVVVSVMADIMVNHSQDIYIKSMSGSYTLVTLRIVSDGNDDYYIQAKTNHTTTVILDARIYTYSDDAVTMYTNNPAPVGTITHDHICELHGLAVSSYGGAQSTVKVSGNTVWHGGNFDPNSKAAASHTHTFNDLSDVVIASPASDHVLMHNGSQWVNTNTPNVKAVNQYGYRTSNTSNTNIGQWTKIATVRMTVQYAAMSTQINIVGGVDGGSSGTAPSGTIFFRVKQQAVLGSAPYVDVRLFDNYYLFASEIAAIVTSVTTSASVVELYVKIRDSYEAYNFTPAITAFQEYITYHDNQGFLTALPAGTVFDARGEIKLDGNSWLRMSSEGHTATGDRIVEFQDTAGARTGYVGHIVSSNPGISLYNQVSNKKLVVTDTGILDFNGFIGNEGRVLATLQNGWVNYGRGYSDATYWKDKNGVVHITGLIQSGTATNGTVLFQLPVGYRPAQRELFITLNANHASTRIDITFDGFVIGQGNLTASFQSLAGIKFKAEN